MVTGVTLRHSLLVLCILLINAVPAQQTSLTDAGEGWAANSVNAVIFRKNALVTHRDTQFIAYYNPDQRVVLGKRKLGSKEWILKVTPYTGRATDAHNTISMMVDGNGYLHLAWDHHNNQLNYSMSKSPGSLELTGKMTMTGLHEERVSYPEFLALRSGDLLFLYRDGESGGGNLVMNHYDIATRKWSIRQQNLIDGEGERNAYWQAWADDKGTIHLSWVWRETPDVASNHDLCYARSKDEGNSWTNSSGQTYRLPITQSTAEYAARIPQQSELINQTSMTATPTGSPVIASYWKESGDSTVQYQLAWLSKKGWQVEQLNFRKTGFSLGGAGTKRIPISRPQLISWRDGRHTAVALLFRDEERDAHVSVAICRNLRRPRWDVFDLLEESLGAWEPCFDSERWKRDKVLSIFIQRVEQVDGEGLADAAPTTVRVLEWTPVRNK